MALRYLAFLVSVALLSPFVSGGASPPPPASVLAIVAEEEVSVVWSHVPMTELKGLSYAIYGRQGASEHLLGTAPGSANRFATMRQFDSYGVATVLEGEKSSTTWMKGCILIHLDEVPPVRLSDYCASAHG